MRLSILAASAAILFATSAMAQPASPPGAFVNGTIKSFDGKILTVTAANGTTQTAAVNATTRVTTNVKKTVADIKPGDFIASGGTMGPDGKLHANEIRIFATPGGEGQFPMAQPGQTMTNATVKDVMTDAKVEKVGTGGVPVIKLSFHGAGAPGAANCTGRAADAPSGPGTGCVGETQFDVPANTPVVAQVASDSSVLKPGAKIVMSVTKAADGSATAARVNITP